MAERKASFQNLTSEQVAAQNREAFDDLSELAPTTRDVYNGRSTRIRIFRITQGSLVVVFQGTPIDNLNLPTVPAEILQESYLITRENGLKGIALRGKTNGLMSNLFPDIAIRGSIGPSQSDIYTESSLLAAREKTGMTAAKVIANTVLSYARSETAAVA